MTTASSPIQVLKAQADAAARKLKSSGLTKCKFGMVMDDKTIIIDVEDLTAVSEKVLAKFILDQMQSEL